MASKVFNGAITKSPVISRINQPSGSDVKSAAAKKIVQLVQGQKKNTSQPVSISFDDCRQEMKRQMTELNKQLGE